MSMLPATGLVGARKMRNFLDMAAARHSAGLSQQWQCGAAERAYQADAYDALTRSWRIGHCRPTTKVTGRTRAAGEVPVERGVRRQPTTGREMSTTVLEALQNAQINFETLGNSGLKANGIFLIAKDQLDNAIAALENGKEPDDVLQEHLGADVDIGA